MTRKERVELVDEVSDILWENFGDLASGLEDYVIRATGDIIELVTLIEKRHVRMEKRHAR